MKFGARAFKTGLSVILALFISSLLFKESYFIAGIAAAMSVFPSIYKSWSHLYKQVLGNIIGASFAIIGFYTLGSHFLAIGFIVILVIAANLKLKLNDTIPLSIVVVIVIMSSPVDDYLLLAISRVCLVLIGIISALIINFLFLPPKNENNLKNSLNSVNKDISSYLVFLLNDNKDFILKLKKDVNNLKKTVNSNLTTTFNLFLDEYRSSIFKKTFHDKKRLIIYRQLVKISKVEVEILNSLINDFFNEYSNSEKIDKKLYDEIWFLTTYKEKLSFHFYRDISFFDEQDKTSILEKNKLVVEELLSMFESADINNWYTVLPIINKTMDLANEINKLEFLLNNYFKSKK